MQTLSLIIFPHSKIISNAPYSYLLRSACLALLIHVILHSQSCSALKAVVKRANQNSSSSIVESIETRTSHFEFANFSFAVTSVLHVPSSEELRSCDMSSEASGDHILFLLNSELRKAGDCAVANKFVMVCEKNPLCQGIIYDEDTDPASNDWYAYAYWYPSDSAKWVVPAWSDTPKYTFTSVPIVMVGPRQRDASAWLFRHGSAKDGTQVMVSIRSGEHNPAHFTLNEPFFKMFSYFSSLHCLYNFYIVCDKLHRWIVVARGDKFSIPIRFILFPELFANMLRFLMFVDFCAFEMQVLPFPLLRFLLTVPYALSIISTAAIAEMMYASHSEAVDGDFRSRQGHRVYRFLQALVGVIIAFDVIYVGIYVSLYGEVINGTMFSAMYTIFQIPVAIKFIRHGTAAAKMLVEGGSSLDSRERQRRERFATRIKAGGVAILVNIALLLVALVLTEHSTPGYLYGFSIAFESLNLVAWFQIDAVAAPAKPSKMKGRRVNPAGTTKSG